MKARARAAGARTYLARTHRALGYTPPRPAAREDEQAHGTRKSEHAVAGDYHARF